MKKFLVVLGLLVSACAPVRALPIGIDPASCRRMIPGGQWFQFANRIDFTDQQRAYTVWQFGTSFDPVIECEFYIFPDMAPSFDPRVLLTFYAESSVSGNVSFGALAVAYPTGYTGSDGPFPYPSAGNVVQILATAPAFVFNTASLSHMPIYDALTGVACSAEGNTCVYHKASMVIMRITDESNCLAANQPFTCCSGLETGTCLTGSNALTPQDLEAIVLY